MRSEATTVRDYLDSLEPARREQMQRTLDIVRPVLPDGLDEGMDGMITWTVPLSRSGDTFNGKPLIYAALASQKQNISLYLMTLYAQIPLTEEEFRARWTGAKKLNLGRSCLRYKNVADVDLGLVEQVLRDVSLDDFMTAYTLGRG